MKAIQEIGFKKTIKFIISPIIDVIFALMIYPQLRVLYLRLLGSTVGKNVIIYNIRFLNFYRGSFSNLIIGDNSFLGNDVVLDLADRITLGNHVTIADRTIILTHLNVGYKDHPLQKYFHSYKKPTKLEDGAFIGVNSTILSGVTIGKGAFIAAGSVVREDISEWTVVGGVPAKVIKKLNHG